MENNNKLEDAKKAFWDSENKKPTGFSKMVILVVVVFVFISFVSKDKTDEDFYVKDDNQEITQMSKEEQEEYDSDNTNLYLKKISPLIKEGQDSNIKQDQIIKTLTKKNDDLEDMFKTYVKEQENIYKKEKNKKSFQNSEKDFFSQPPVGYGTFGKDGANKGYGNNNTPQVKKVTFIKWSNTVTAIKPLSEADKTGAIKSQATPKSKKKKFPIIPSSSLMLIKIDNGVMAGTMSTGKGSLVPVTSTVVSNTFMPNGKEFNNRGCKILLEAMGKASNERNYFAGARHSCVKDDGTMIDIPIQGYTTDIKSGMVGLQGKVVSKQDELFYAALWAYAIEGMSGSIAGATSDVVTTAQGSVSVADSSKMLQNGILGGIGKAGSEVGGEILKIAKNMEAVIETLGGQYMVFHVTEPLQVVDDVLFSDSESQDVKTDFNPMAVATQAMNSNPMNKILGK